jgi:hypothetical protein
MAVADQIDAMLISEKYRLATLNGYTGYQPPGWGLLDPNSPGYLRAVSSWASQHGVETGLCQLDLATMQWQTRPTPVVQHA